MGTLMYGFQYKHWRYFKHISVDTTTICFDDL